MIKQPEQIPGTPEDTPLNTNGWYTKINSKAAALASSALLSLGLGAGESTASSDSSKASERSPSALIVDGATDLNQSVRDSVHTSEVDQTSNLAAEIAVAAIRSAGIGHRGSSELRISHKLLSEKAPSGLVDKKPEVDSYSGEQYTDSVFDKIWRGEQYMGIFNGLVIIDGRANLHNYLDPKVQKRSFLPLNEFYHKHGLTDSSKTLLDGSKFGSMRNPMVLVDHGTTWVGISMMTKNWDHWLRKPNYEPPLDNQAQFYGEMVWVPLNEHNSKYVQFYAGSPTSHFPTFMHAEINRDQRDDVYGKDNLNAIPPNGNYRALLPSQLASWDLWQWDPTVPKGVKFKINDYPGTGIPVFKPKSQLASYLKSLRSFPYYLNAKPSKFPSPSKLEDMLEKLDPEYGIGD